MQASDLIQGGPVRKSSAGCREIARLLCSGARLLSNRCRERQVFSRAHTLARLASDRRLVDSRTVHQQQLQNKTPLA
jgi:hypothetical protein